MENWGLITYKEQYLIVEETSHHRERFDSLRVIAHELGHQFFGQLLGYCSLIKLLTLFYLSLSNRKCSYLPVVELHLVRHLIRKNGLSMTLLFYDHPLG